MSSGSRRALALLLAVLLLGGAAAVNAVVGRQAARAPATPHALTLPTPSEFTAAPPHPASELWVCADPNNLPFSNRREEGFENQIARMVADELGLTLRYFWQPQRR